MTLHVPLKSAGYAKFNHDSPGPPVNLAHQQDLLTPLIVIVLIDANRIDLDRAEASAP